MPTTLTKKTTLSDAVLTLAQQFPYTYHQMKKELGSAPTQRIANVKSAIARMEKPQKSDVQFEAVIPRQKSMSSGAALLGNNLEECLKGVKKMLPFYQGPAHVFINMKGGISVAISPHDFSEPQHVWQTDDDHGMFRIVWSRTERGMLGLGVAPEERTR